MSWFINTLICILGWGGADLFYKKGSDEADRYSHLKIAVWVGLVMGAFSFALIFASGEAYSLSRLVKNTVCYSPASLCYIISMVVGYAGLRYLEVSIVSPVQNASGAFSTLCMIIYFFVIGKIDSIFDEFSALDIVGTLFIVAGMIALAFFEQRLSGVDDKKYRFGALALLFPIIYCLFDTFGTAADGIILDDASGLSLSETDVTVAYGLTFLLFGIGAWITLLIKNKKPYNPFEKSEGNKCAAAICEQFGQVFYVYAMADRPVLAAPMVASYCIVSALLGRIFLKERLKASQYVCIFAVICGIVLLGISEGLGEM